jgi:hypothetical protein
MTREIRASLPQVRRGVASADVRVRIEQVVGAPLEAVEAALIDAAYLARLAELPKLGAPQLLGQEHGDSVVRQRVRYQFVGDLNAAVRRVVDPARLTWVEVTTVDLGTHDTEWHIEPDHYASLLRARGQIRLEAVDGAGPATRRVADIDLRVTFPLVGSKVERAIASGLEEHAALEAEALAAWLGAAGS